MCFAQKHKIEINENLCNLRNLRSSYFLTPYFLTFLLSLKRSFVVSSTRKCIVWRCGNLTITIKCSSAIVYFR